MNQKLLDTKIFKILSYVSILWIVGAISPYRNEKDVQFHVNQGKILTVFFVVFFALAIILDKFLFANVFVTKIVSGGTEAIKYVRNDAGRIIGDSVKTAVVIIYIIYSAIGIKNAIQLKEKSLPFIGRYSFKWRRR